MDVSRNGMHTAAIRLASYPSPPGMTGCNLTAIPPIIISA